MAIGIRDLRPDQIELLEAYECFLSRGYSSLTLELHGGEVRLIERERVKRLKDLKS